MASEPTVGKTRAALRSRPHAILSKIVAEAFGLRACDLIAATRGGANVALARQAAMYLARVTQGMTLSEAARAFGRERTTAAHACRVVEDRRDDPRFDAKLAEIEALLMRDPEGQR